MLMQISNIINLEYSSVLLKNITKKLLDNKSEVGNSRLRIKNVVIYRESHRTVYLGIQFHHSSQLFPSQWKMVQKYKLYLNWKN